MSEQNQDNKAEDDKRYWLDDPANVTKIVWALVAVCAGLFVADAFYHKHGPFDIEHLFGFFGIFGFVMCVALVLGARWMRTFLQRPEDYYDPDE
jgi:hypothetical protein